MSEMSNVEKLVLDHIAKAGGHVHVNDLFARIRTFYVPVTDTEIP